MSSLSVLAAKCAANVQQMPCAGNAGNVQCEHIAVIWLATRQLVKRFSKRLAIAFVYLLCDAECALLLRFCAPYAQGVRVNTFLFARRAVLPTAHWAFA